MLQLCRRYREGGGDRQAEFPTVLGPICELNIVVYESILQYIICIVYTYIHTYAHTIVEARKLEHGFRRIRARIPYNLP